MRATDRGGLHSYDGGKKLPAVKRHLRTDTFGTILTACVSPASVNDRDRAARVLLARARELLWRRKHVWVDQGYRGPDFIGWIWTSPGVPLKIVVRAMAAYPTKVQ
ncbi:transposase [Nonomuraea fuscirosea]|uniref:transposase n=1 Tax=Nonomuraea fuscirosea TaxID=1291556 RepID=UPI00343CAF5E